VDIYSSSVSFSIEYTLLNIALMYRSRSQIVVTIPSLIVLSIIIILLSFYCVVAAAP
jgi:hypothetical protein